MTRGCHQKWHDTSFKSDSKNHIRSIPRGSAKRHFHPRAKTTMHKIERSFYILYAKMLNCTRTPKTNFWLRHWIVLLLLPKVKPKSLIHKVPVVLLTVMKVPQNCCCCNVLAMEEVEDLLDRASSWSTKQKFTFYFQTSNLEKNRILPTWVVINTDQFFKLCNNTHEGFPRYFATHRL